MTEMNNGREQARPDSGRVFFKPGRIKLPTAGAHLIFWTVSILGLAMDLLTKWIVFENVEPGQSVPVIDGVVQFVHVLNTGAAFGIMADKTGYLILVSFAAIVIVLGLFLFGDVRQKISLVALGLFTAGICGNLYDRLFNEGMVRDFIDVVYWPGRHWPAFNAADSMLCIGVALMIITAYVTERPCRKHARQQK
jgi:signal peptidase II